MTNYSLIPLLALFCCMTANAAETRHLDSELSLTYDDNVTRGAGSRDKRSDTVASAGASMSQTFRLGERSGVLLRGGLRHNEYSSYHDLSHLILTAGGIYRVQPVVSYSAPVLELGFNIDQRLFRDSDIRDGQVARLDAGLSSRLTDRIRLRAGAGIEKRWADEGSVYDMTNRKLTMQMDYRLPGKGTLVFGWHRIFGDQAFTATPGPGILSVAHAVDDDPVFGTRRAYRLDAIANLFNLDFNLPVNHSNSLNINAQVAGINADGGNDYRNNQLRLSWLHRFW